MRLQQQAGLTHLDHNNTSLCTVTPTYDLGCPFGVKTKACPWGSVHNINKRPIGARIAAQIVQSINTPHPGVRKQWPGPTLVKVVAKKSVDSQGVTVTLTFAEGIMRAPTAYCDACCSRGTDFDVSGDNGRTWINSTLPHLVNGTADGTPSSLEFHVKEVVRVTHVRYTANQPFPQCAVYSASMGTASSPTLPFRVALDADGEWHRQGV